MINKESNAKTRKLLESPVNMCEGQIDISTSSNSNMTIPSSVVSKMFPNEKVLFVGKYSFPESRGSNMLASKKNSDSLVDTAVPSSESAAESAVESAAAMAMEEAVDAAADRQPQPALATAMARMSAVEVVPPPPSAVAVVPPLEALQPGRMRVVNDRLTVLSVVNNNMDGLNILDIMTSVLGNFVDEGDVITNGAKNYLRESYMLASLGENNEDVGKIVWKSLYENKNMGITTSVGVERFIVGGGSYGIYNDVTGVLINFYEKKKAHGKVKNARHIYFLGRK